MGKRLVIAEKPMLAKAILDAIPGTAKRRRRTCSKRCWMILKSCDKLSEHHGR